MGETFAQIISLIIGLLTWAIIIRALLSWVPSLQVSPYHPNPIIRGLFAITEPILEPLRRYVTIQMVDLSPIVAIIVLRVLEFILLTLIGATPGRILF